MTAVHTDRLGIEQLSVLGLPPVEFVNLRSVHSAPLPRPQLTVPVPNRDTPIYQRDLLPLGAQFDDPAIVEQPDTTTVVYPGFTCRVDDVGNLLLTLHTR